MEPGPDRGRAGKSDQLLVGSCAVSGCDGPTEGNCYCSDDCVEGGDCCPDKLEVCDGEYREYSCEPFTATACMDSRFVAEREADRIVCVEPNP
jgi:hypothetical protein